MPVFWGYPRCPMITHTFDSYCIPSPNKTKSKLHFQRVSLPKLQICGFGKKTFHKRHTWSCLIKCVDMKWIQPVLLKIRSAHNCSQTGKGTDGRTVRQGETSVAPLNFVEAGYNYTYLVRISLYVLRLCWSIWKYFQRCFISKVCAFAAQNENVFLMIAISLIKQPTIWNKRICIMRTSHATHNNPMCKFHGIYCTSGSLQF